MELVFLLVACLFNEMLSPCSLDPHNIINCLKKKKCTKDKQNRFVLVTTQDTYKIKYCT